jgi:hypothetical protein
MATSLGAHARTRDRGRRDRPEYEVGSAGKSFAVTDTKALRRDAATYLAKAAEERHAAERERRLAARAGDTAGTHLAAALVHDAAARQQSRLAHLGDELIVREQAGRFRSLRSRVLRRQRS